MFFKFAPERWSRGKTCFYLGIKPSTSLWVQTQNTHFLLIFASIFLLFLPFYKFLAKNVKKHISTSIWSAQHPNAGSNLLHTIFPALGFLGVVNKKLCGSQLKLSLNLTYLGKRVYFLCKFCSFMQFRMNGLPID